MSSFPPAREEEREKLLSQSVGSGVLKVGTPPTSTPSAGSPMSKLSGSIGNGISYVGGRVKEGLNRTRTLSLEAVRKHMRVDKHAPYHAVLSVGGGLL